MKEDIQYLRQRVDGIADVLTKNTTVLEANTESLKEHMKRTELLEEQMETALIPIKASKILAYVLGFIGTIAGAVVGLHELFK